MFLIYPTFYLNQIGCKGFLKARLRGTTVAAAISAQHLLRSSGACCDFRRLAEARRKGADIDGGLLLFRARPQIVSYWGRLFGHYRVCKISFFGQSSAFVITRLCIYGKHILFHEQDVPPRIALAIGLVLPSMYFLGIIYRLPLR